mmetsp:Transcript_9290/g.15291  ORF Transcript_9290/g.15291 Transcript_9290/m.15291 type:complete len:755 (-) Transcript_9290:49-2313(-)
MEMFHPQQHISPTASPERQANNTDPFAAFAVGPAMPNVAAPSMAPPAQPPQQQPQQQDPWAMNAAAPPAQAPAAPMAAPPAAPLQPQMNSYVAPPPVQQMPTYTAPAPVQQPTYTAPSVGQITPPVPQQPVMQMPTAQPPAAPIMPAQMPPAMPQAQPVQQPPAAVPPITDVYDDPQNKEPDSPIGNVSAILNQEPPEQPGPSMPTMFPVNESAPTMQQPAPAPQPIANPFDFGPVASSMPSAQPTAVPTNVPLSPPRGNQNDPTGTLSPPMSPVNALAPQNVSDPFGYCFSPMPSSGGGNAIVPSAAPVADPFGVFGGQQLPPAMPVCNPVQAPPAPTSVPSQAVVPSSAPNNDPFGVFGGGQQTQPPSADPFGAAIVPAAAPTPTMDDDPFGVFSAPTPTPVAAPAPAQPTAAVDAASAGEDPWAAAGFGARPGTSNVTQEAPSTPNRYAQESTPKEDEVPVSLDSNGLPADGEYYEVRIGARSLGVMFYTAREMKDSLLQKVPRKAIEAMGSRPIVSYVAKNSAAYNSGILLGHTVLEVNGEPVTNAEHCAELIRTCPRPLNVRCFNPNFEVVLSENKHLVKYDTLDMEAPKNSNEWKQKYVVVGGIVANEWTVNMFYNKADYDTAVKETHTGQKISVKIKQFDLRGAKIILRDMNGKPNWINYPGEPAPWHYFTILPRRGYPIKISSQSLEELEPVYRAVRTFLQKDAALKNQHAQQYGHYVEQESVYQTVDKTPPRGAGRVRNTKDSYW